MADRSKIEWTDATWNPLRGCSRMSEGCRYCYAEGMAARFSGEGQPFEGLTSDGKWNGSIKLVEDKLLLPLRWRRPRRVFVTSVSDPFHPAVTDAMLDKLFVVMALAPQHKFQLLTKRPERMREYTNHSCGRIADAIIRFRRERGDSDMMVVPIPHIRPGMPWWPLPNMWLGTSVENQQAADERIPHLLATPAAVRFLSCEPLLGPVDMAWALSRNRLDIAAGFHRRGHFSPGLETLRPLDWVIVGGESGPKARTMHPDWARSMRDQCAAAGVPFLFKQWGEWGDFTNAQHPHGIKGNPAVRILDGNGNAKGGGQLHNGYDWQGHGRAEMIRVGKKAAGRLLDGQEYNAFPEERHG